MYTIQRLDHDTGSWVNHPSSYNSLKEADKYIKDHRIPNTLYRIIPTDLEIRLIPPAPDHHFYPVTEQERISDQAVLDKLKVDAAALRDATKPPEPEPDSETKPKPIPEHKFNKTLKKERRRERYGENYETTSPHPAKQNVAKRNVAKRSPKTTSVG